MRTAPHLFVLLLAALALAGCSSAVTPARLRAVTGGMKIDQVVTLLGQPSRIQHTEITGLAGDAYIYNSSRGQAVVVFIDGAVFRTDYLPGDQP